MKKGDKVIVIDEPRLKDTVFILIDDAYPDGRVKLKPTNGKWGALGMNCIIQKNRIKPMKSEVKNELTKEKSLPHQ